MVGRKSKRTAGDEFHGAEPVPSLKAFTQFPSAPATGEDKAQWKGFCEIESDPAFFNVMLKQFGVRGVKVHEIVSLDDEILLCLPRPVYGLIFLFRWTEEDPDKQEQSCPDEVWFANQTINNACASVALLNIVNNVPNIELGEHLHVFKKFTTSFSPALRGDAIGNFEFVKGIHNSFARKMDMLNADLFLKNEATTKATSKAKSRKRKANDEDSESGFHFIAFMPIEGQLWKLDGLERQPMCLGAFQDEWLGQVKPDLEARMAQYEDRQIEFAILSLVRDPLLDLIPRLAENVRSLNGLSARLDAVKPDWREFEMPSASDDATAVLTGPDPMYGMMQEHLDRARYPENVETLCESEAVEDMTTQRQQLVTAQAGLRLSIKEEQQSNQSDEEKAAARRCDYGARMQDFVRRVKTKKRALDEVETVSFIRKYETFAVSMEEKRVDPEIQIDINEMILDYLGFVATENALENYASRGGNDVNDAHGHSITRGLLQLVDSYLVVFHAIQPSRSCDRNLRFRLQLLRFTTMFMSRSGFGDATPSASALQMLRQKRHNEASSFRSGNEDFMRPDLPNLTEYMTSPDIVAIKQERISPKSSPGIETPPVAHVRPFPPPVSLLDTLPAFMALSAAQNAVHEATITEVWMHLAAGYMVQAVAEQSLAYEVQGSGVLQEAFAWGFDADCTAQEGSDEWQINAMFFGQDEMVYGWDVIRDEHMRALIPPEGTGLQEHLEKLLEGDLSVNKFEHYVLGFLTGLHSGQPRPLLAQVESGEMDGLSRREVRAFQTAVGLSSSGD